MVEGKEFPSGGLTRFLFLPETSLYTYSSREPRDSPSWAADCPQCERNRRVRSAWSISRVTGLRLDRSIFRTSVTLKIRSKTVTRAAVNIVLRITVQHNATSSPASETVRSPSQVSRPQAGIHTELDHHATTLKHRDRIRVSDLG